MPTIAAPELDAAATRAAAALHAAGVRPGDRVGVITAEHGIARARQPQAQADVLAVVWGALRSGVVPVLVSPMLTAVERTFIATDAGLATPLIDPAQAAVLVAARNRPIDLAPRAIARPMHYTSGTTGTPKGVVADLTPHEATTWWDDEIAHWGFTADDVTLVHSPLCHSAPLRFAIGTLEVGGSVALTGRFDPVTIARTLAESRVTTAFTAPAHWQQLFQFQLPESPYRLLAHAGAPCPAPLKRQIHAWNSPQRTVEFLGSTEGQFTSCPGPEWEQRPGTLGRARGNRTLSIGADDTIWCTAPRFARFEYWNAPAKTAAAWRDTPAGPAFSVGDLGRLDDAGYLFLTGRRDDLILSGGVNVYPAEVEAVLAAHPLVADVVVFGVPDERWGQRVACAVVGDVTPQQLRDWAGERLAPYKLPKTWVPLADLPRNSMGKVNRTELAAVLGLG